MIRFGIDVAHLTEDEFYGLVYSLNAIEDITNATLCWSSPKETTVFVEYSFRTNSNKECAHSMLADLCIDFPVATSMSVL